MTSADEPTEQGELMAANALLTVVTASLGEIRTHLFNAEMAARANRRLTDDLRRLGEDMDGPRGRIEGITLRIVRELAEAETGSRG